MFKLESPYYEQLRDKDKHKEFFENYPVIPYAGTSKASGHTLLKVFVDLYDLSPSFGNAVNSIGNWSFNGGFSVVSKPHPYLRLNEDAREVSDQEAIDFISFLEDSGIDQETIIEISNELFRDLNRAGNAFLHYREAVVDGVFKVSLKVVHPLLAMYINNKDDEPKSLVISSDYFIYGRYMKPPKVVRVYPDFSEDEEGVVETIFVLKNKRDFSDYYGRPKSLQAILPMWAEWNTYNQIGKITSTDFVSRALVVLPRPPKSVDTPLWDQANRLGDLGVALKSLTTNRGDYSEADSMGVLYYPPNGQKPDVLKFDINRDYEWTDMTLDKLSGAIYASVGWSRVLTSQNEPSAGIGGNVMMDVFKVKNTSTIKPVQKQIAQFWKKTVFKRLIELSGRQDYEEYSIEFYDKIQELIDSVKDSNGEGEDILAEGVAEVDGDGTRAPEDIERQLEI